MTTFLRVFWLWNVITCTVENKLTSSMDYRNHGPPCSLKKTVEIPEDSQFSLFLSATLNPSICVMPSKETAFISKIQEAWFILENIGAIMTWESRLTFCQMQRSHMEAVSWDFYSTWKKKAINQSVFENTLVEPRRGTARWVLLCYWPWIPSANMSSSLIGGKAGFC